MSRASTKELSQGIREWDSALILERHTDKLSTRIFLVLDLWTLVSPLLLSKIIAGLHGSKEI